jgi:hypothetical protein|tara:strand:- start:93 stop:482 length:390 start_codon:yes stop_codon:yes gene_type:complete
MDIQKAFNKHFIEFVDDIASYFSDRVEIQTTANALRMMRKTNPKLIINVWYSSIVQVYDEQIERGDINFFITKEYSEDVADLDGNDEVLNGIDKIREPIQKMPIEDQEKSMKYVQNLTKLCKLYYLNRN